MRRWLLVLLGVFGTALLYGDGMITPAISVLSAVEGLEVAAPSVAPLGHPDRGRHPGRAVRGAAARHRSIGRGLRPGHAGLVRGARPCSGQRAGRPSRGCSALNPIYAVALLRRQRWTWLPRARLGLPGRHRRRGAVRRHGSLRPPADPAWPGSARAAGAGPQLLRPGRAAARRPRAIENPFYLLAPDWAPARWSCWRPSRP